MHYQRKRRRGDMEVGTVGRPRKYPEDVADSNRGAPRFTVRLEPEVLEWVRSQGGGTWLRFATGKLMELSQEPEFEVWWREFELDDD